MVVLGEGGSFVSDNGVSVLLLTTAVSGVHFPASTLCGSEHVLVVSTEPPDDLSCLGGGGSYNQELRTSALVGGPQIVGDRQPNAIKDTICGGMGGVQSVCARPGDHNTSKPRAPVAPPLPSDGLFKSRRF